MVVVPDAVLSLDLKVCGGKVLVAMFYCCEIGDGFITIKPAKAFVSGGPCSISTSLARRIESPFGRVLWLNDKLPC